MSDILSHRPTVSVMMPVWKPHPVYFPAAVRGIIAQTLTDWELVIVEAPSDQSAEEMLREFNDLRIRHVLDAPPTSLRQQRNRCLSESRSDLIICHDADDVSEPHRFKCQVEFLQSHPDIAVAGSQLTIVDADGSPIGSRTYPTAHDDILRSMRRYNAVAQPSAIFRKQTVLAAGGYTLAGTCEDYDLWSRLLLGQARFANLPEALVRYRIHSEASKEAQLKLTIRNTLAIKRAYWLPTMTIRDRLRLGVERLLLIVPAKLVLAIFKRMQYRKLPKVH